MPLIVEIDCNADNKEVSCEILEKSHEKNVLEISSKVELDLQFLKKEPTEDPNYDDGFMSDNSDRTSCSRDSSIFGSARKLTSSPVLPKKIIVELESDVQDTASEATSETVCTVDGGIDSDSISLSSVSCDITSENPESDSSSCNTSRTSSCPNLVEVLNESNPESIC
jgi:hypothetical protein